MTSQVNRMKAFMKTKMAHISAEGFDQLFKKVCNWGRWGPNDERGTLITRAHFGAAVERSSRIDMQDDA